MYYDMVSLFSSWCTCVICLLSTAGLRIFFNELSTSSDVGVFKSEKRVVDGVQLVQSLDVFGWHS